MLFHYPMWVQKVSRWPSIILGGACGVLVSLLYYFPGVFSLETVTGFVHLTAMRPLAIALMVGILCVAGLVLLFVRSTWLLSAMVVIAVATGAVAGQWAARGFATSAEVAAPSARHLTVVSGNVLIGNDSYEGLLQRAKDDSADVIALQEAAHTTVERMLGDLGLTGTYEVTPPTPTAGPADADSILLVKKELEPKVIDATGLPFATAGMRTKYGEMYSVHAHAPVQRAREQRNWARSVETERRLCQRAVVVAGDFNATTASPLMRGGRCANAGETLNMGARGTWPSALPSLLGARIDHQLYLGGSLTPVAGEMFNIQGSDHRGLEFTYNLVGQ